MSYIVHGLEPAPFAPLFSLSDAELEAQGSRRVIADAKPGFPCRVSLADAEPGEALILVSHAHHTTESSPYRATGPIFVRETARAAAHAKGTLPAYLTARMLSLRAYDGNGMMVEAEVTEGADAEPLIERFLARDDVAYLHAHFASRGCYAARIERG